MTRKAKPTAADLRTEQARLQRTLRVLRAVDDVRRHGGRHEPRANGGTLAGVAVEYGGEVRGLPGISHTREVPEALEVLRERLAEIEAALPGVEQREAAAQQREQRQREAAAQQCEADAAERARVALEAMEGALPAVTEAWSALDRLLGESALGALVDGRAGRAPRGAGGIRPRHAVRRAGGRPPARAGGRGRAAGCGHAAGAVCVGRGRAAAASVAGGGGAGAEPGGCTASGEAALAAGVSSMQNCEGTNRAGEPCGMPPLAGSRFCWAHCPENREQRRQARALGGRRRPRIGRPAAVAGRTALRTVEDILRLLERATADQLALPNSAQRNRTLATLAGAALRALEVGELEMRLRQLERAAGMREAV